MIEKDRKSKKFTMRCDQRGCENYEEFDTAGDFKEMVKLAKDSGWKICKDMDFWNHTCPVCADK
jgi:hypothetical protein